MLSNFDALACLGFRNVINHSRRKCRVGFPGPPLRTLGARKPEEIMSAKEGASE
jgi:hypothetical protein